jgi:hypothetical protein
MTALVVFDTCTKPPYYADVHKLLALPSGSYLRYDYEEKLFSEEALATLKAAKAADMPLDAFLFYGQFHAYKKGDADPKGQVFSTRDAILIPTRYARIRNVAFDRRVGGQGQPRTNVIFHMELLGFPDPDAPAIPGLLDMLSQRGELPFSKWIAQAPADMDLDGLRQPSSDLWGKVVDRLAAEPSQFNGDVFWRIGHVEKVSGATSRELYPAPRTTNAFGAKEFLADYPLEPLADYRVTITNIIPGTENKELPATAAVAAVEDTTKLLSLPDKDRPLRRNDGVQINFNVNRLDELTTRYAKLAFTTVVEDHPGPFPAGSSADISVAIRSSGYKVALIFLLVAVAVFAGGTITAIVKDGNWLLAGLLAMIAVAGAVGASYLHYGKLKFPGMKD